MSDRISISNALTYILIIISVVGGIYGFGKYVDSRIEHVVNDEQFIKKVASHVRPYVIFDKNETIHVDGGAMQYLEKIEVEKVGKGKEMPELKITITPKHHLAYAPHLETLTLTFYEIKQERGSGHQWIYELTLLGEHYISDKEKQVERFRLEILR